MIGISARIGRLFYTIAFLRFLWVNPSMTREMTRGISPFAR